jgi:hypothetical protein
MVTRQHFMIFTSYLRQWLVLSGVHSSLKERAGVKRDSTCRFASAAAVCRAEDDT